MSIHAPHPMPRGRQNRPVCRRFLIAVGCLATLSSGSDWSLAARPAEISVSIVDEATQEPIPFRFQITNAEGRVPSLRNVPRQGKDYTFDGTATFELKPGRYQFLIDRGPHYRQRTGNVDVEKDGSVQKNYGLPRFADPRQEGWYSGDLLVERPPKNMELLAQAEELDWLGSPTWIAGQPLTEAQARQSREELQLNKAVVDYSCGVLRSSSAELLAIGLGEPSDPTSVPTEPLAFAEWTRQRHGLVALLNPDADDLPMLVAHGVLDAIVLLGPLQRADGDKPLPSNAFRNEPRYRQAVGAGLFARDIYFRLLNCGLRVSPAAASASGICHNPPGYNRAYVSCGQDFSAATWRQNLTQGRVIISNGPVLRTRMNQQLPGHVFPMSPGSSLQIDVACELGTRHKVDYLEIVKNGKTVESIPLGDWVKQGGHLPLVPFDASGWLLVQAVAKDEQHFRLAMTAPIFVESGAPRISKIDSQFFLDWVYRRATELRKDSSLPPEEAQQSLAAQRVARDFWKGLVERANAP